MNKYKLLIVFVLALQSCQLIVLSPDKTIKNKFIANQNSAEGVFNLFLLQLDSNDVYAAAFLRTDSTGQKRLPIWQYESIFELSRLQRQINNLPITRIKFDTLNRNSILLYVEFDYLREVEFLASKIDSTWYISNKKSWKNSLY
jgi:hypothetical protein